jgi:hypothetical protein
MVACGDDDSAESTAPTTPAVATSTAPVVTPPSVSAPPATTAGATTPDTLPATSAARLDTTTPGGALGGYEEVTAEQLLPLAADGKSDPITDPLGDGVYYALAYTLTEDGSAVRFDLARFISAEACIDELGTVPDGTVDQAPCYGGVEDTAATASVTMLVDGPTPVILVTPDFRFFRVTAAELGRLLAGEAPAADAPPGFEYQPHWRAMVEVVDGEIARVNQQPSS